jgi:alkanesulfonate monooxygenase SsuD/methylene tetrahydromethanopterin reductase-like flavin-dependent oxidoreductase (luciferase family)
MKFMSFNLMPYRFLPMDFPERHRSVWVDIPGHLFDPEKGHQLYNEYMDQLEYAAELGFDGICVNEHHANGYGIMPSPNIIAAGLARRTKNAAIVVLGNSVALYNPPVRIAEEFAMLDCISGGRLVAGFPVGTSMDTNYAYGEVPTTLREKYYEGVRLILEAWKRNEVFSFNGEFTQMRYVNCWPKPIQRPHPPIWIPGGGSVETWDYCADNGFLYSYLSFSGYKRAKVFMDGFWDTLVRKGLPANPYQAGFVQFVAVADSDQHAADLYGAHAEWFFNKTQHIYGGFVEAPGYRTLNTIKLGMESQQKGPRLIDTTWKEMIERGTVIAGTPKRVTEQIEDLCRTLNVGHLGILAQFGDMPHDKVLYNLRRIATEVTPSLKSLWDDRWEDHWWPRAMTNPRLPRADEPALAEAGQ